MSSDKQVVSIAHSPDSDDAFMFYALARGIVSSPGIEFRHVLSDIQALNAAAREGRYDMTAISYHAYPYVADKYVLTRAGSSVGDGYGPIVIAKKPLSPQELRGRKIAVPGLLTTAYLALRLFEPNFEPEVVPFDEILTAVDQERFDAGLVIHEGQLTWSRSGLHNVLDLGAWWKDRHGLPLPLGANALLRSLDDDVRRECRRCLSESIRYALDHRADALEYALQFGRGLDFEHADRFVGMYVNEYTVDLKPEVAEAAQKLLDEGHQAGLIKERVRLEFV